MRRHEHQAGPGAHRVERAEDRRVPDRMGHDAGVELGVAGTVDLAAAALVAAAAALGVSAGMLLVLLVSSELVHPVEQAREIHAR